MKRKTAIMCGTLLISVLAGIPVYSMASVQADTIMQEEQKNENYSTQTSKQGNSESEEESNKENDTQDRILIEEKIEDDTKDQTPDLSLELGGDLLEEPQEDPIKGDTEELIGEEIDLSVEKSQEQQMDTYLKWFQIDGGYQEWRDLPHTDISWYSPDPNQVHQGALYLENDILYGHFLMNDAYQTQMVVSYIELTINEKTKVTLTIQKSTTDGKIDWSENMYQLPVGTTTGLGVFYNEYPNYYMGEAAFTVYDAQHKSGDEVEFFIDLNVISSITNIPIESMKQIQLYNPNIGWDAIRIAGGSSGAFLGIILACTVAGTAIWFKKSEKKVEREDELDNTH
ncbi:Firmicu-CTERM sorting domain-containing protein [Anaerosporobacter faecicola]|uniref:Firmicu-CTERM sorting domain-containing protein n=1 Tax=Anaerosporobacter faecicola TaxID=2718714 RepID=UPI0014389B7C|nr:Firmicu-CTERM sorting domain-containing protein [Anaerosporobacter faecicola]